MPVISVVVPVYKVEKYLERCVESLMHQTLQDIEMILVDDGSPDGCGKLCDTLKEKDGRIRVVHKKNGGLSSARNAGMKIACGTYIGFLDSDDDVDREMFRRMVQAAENSAADLVMSDYIRIWQDGSRALVTTPLRDGLYEKKDMVKHLYPALIMGEQVDYGPVLSVCHCIYRRSFLEKNQITFAEDVRWSEDNLFNAIAVYHAERFFYLKKEGLYHYYQNPGTITTSYRRGAWEVYKRMHEYMEQYFAKVPDYDFNRQLKLHLIYYACNTIRMECKNAKGRKDAAGKMKKILCDPELKEAFRNFTWPDGVSLKLKIQLWLMKQGYAWFLAAAFRR